MSLEVLRVLEVKIQPQIKARVAGRWQVTQNEVKSVNYMRMRT